MTTPALLEDTLEGRLAKRMADETFSDRAMAEYYLRMLKIHRESVVNEIMDTIDSIRKEMVV